MSVSRRAVLGSALASPLLSQVVTAPTAAASGVAGEGRDGWVEIWPTPETLAQLDQIGATIEAIAPAQLVDRPDGSKGLRMPVSTAQGDPSLLDPARAHGNATLAGEIVVRNADGEVRFTQLDGVLKDERLSGHCKANGQEQALRPVLTWRASDSHITIIPGLPTEPVSLRVSELPVRPSQESIDAFTSEFGTPIFTTNTVMAHITAQGRYITIL